MNKNGFVILAIALMLISACKKEESNDSCIQTDFIGTYSGTNKCEGEDAEEVSFSIEERGGDLYLSDSEGQEFPIEPNGCTFDIPTIDIIFAKVSGTGKLAGNKLTITQQLSVFGISTTCKFEGTK